MHAEAEAIEMVVEGRGCRGRMGGMGGGEWDMEGKRVAWKRGGEWESRSEFQMAPEVAVLSFFSVSPPSIHPTKKHISPPQQSNA